MEIGVHAPNWLVIIVSLLLAVLALIGYFLGAVVPGFWIAIFAYVVAAGGVLVKT